MACSRPGRWPSSPPHLGAGARVASVGAKLGASWNVIINFFVRCAGRPYTTTFRGRDRPRRELERYADAIRHRDLALGGACVAWGTISAKGRAGS